MAELRLRLDVRFTPAAMRWGLAGLLLFAGAPELGSESVTLTSYYPAPSGIYTQMITTGNTYLARDGGNTTKVGLGTTSPSQKLDVVGGIGALAYNPAQATWASYGTGYGGAAIYNDGGPYFKLMIVGNNSGGGGIRRVGLWDDVTVSNNLQVNGSANAGGAVTAGGMVRAGTSMVADAPSCYDTNWTYGAPTGGTHVMCAGGYYVTLNDGYMSRKMVLTNSQEPGIVARCCPCPSSGCSIAGW